MGELERQLSDVAERWSWLRTGSQAWPSAMSALLRAILLSTAAVVATGVLSGPALYGGLVILCALIFGLPAYFTARHTQVLLKTSLTDPLTSIGNRRALEARLEEESARCIREHLPLAILMIDVDKLKEINDNNGHRSGDEALRLVGRALRRSTRVSDVVGRLGGDEFMVIAPNTSLKAACALGERIAAATREESAASSGVSDLGLSIGVAYAESEGEALKGLLNAADGAMYEAKRAGGGRVVAARPCVLAKVVPLRPIMSP